MDSINNRIREIRIRFCGDSNISFARQLGKKPNTVNNWIRQDYSVGRGVISQILEAFPMINPAWLASGEGEMLRYPPLKENNTSDKGKIVPLYDIDIIPENNTENNPATVPLHHPGTINVGWMLKDSEAALRVYGNSMAPNYPPGCIVGLKPHKDNFIEPGGVYVVETGGNRYMKRLYMNRQNDAYRCISDNDATHDTGPMAGEYRHPEFEIPVCEVVRLHRVVGVIKRNAM